jgi:hypothetical protein
LVLSFSNLGPIVFAGQPPPRLPKHVDFGTSRHRRPDPLVKVPSATQRLAIIHRMQTLRAEASLLEKEMDRLRAEFEQFVDSDEGDEDEFGEIDEY